MGRALGRGKVFVVFNPKAGKGHHADELRAILERYFAPPGWEPELYETTGREDLAQLCRAACARGASLVIAAGGDGTLDDVANGLAGGSVPLGILPLGSANFLARTLNIPMKMEEAAELLAGDHAVAQVDALEVKGRLFFTNVGVGISPGIIRETKSADKKLYGRLAYVMALTRAAKLFLPHRYRLNLDGRLRFLRAVEVVVSNTTLLERPNFLYGPPETLADGRLEVYVLSARAIGDYVRLAWDLICRSGKPAVKLKHWTVRRSVGIDAVNRSPIVQADGELIGRTPVEIRLVPKALRVIVPKTPAP
jgi:diacylglycerol kinase family enzyme